MKSKAERKHSWHPEAMFQHGAIAAGITFASAATWSIFLDEAMFIIALIVATMCLVFGIYREATHDLKPGAGFSLSGDRMTKYKWGEGLSWGAGYLVAAFFPGL